MATLITAENVQECIRELNTISTSEIKSDDLSLGLYATDASLYQIHPLAVAIPSSEADLINIIQIANKYNVPVLPRGSATSLAGQTTNQALIIDFTKYFDKNTSEEEKTTLSSIIGFSSNDQSSPPE